MRRSRLGEIQDKFWIRVEKAGDDDCWIWKGTNGPDGYGYIAGKLFGERLVPVGKAMLAHRVSWIMANGPLPANPPGYHGWVVMHTCDNRKCVNPSHLRLATQTANVADMDAKGRDNRHGITQRGGTKHGRAALGVEQVAAIMLGDRTDAEFACEFGVSAATVKRVRLGATYKEESAGGKRLRERYSAAGEANPSSKLSYEQVKMIRTSDASTYALAKQLGVSQVAVAMARRGATYKEVDVPCPPRVVGRARKLI